MQTYHVIQPVRTLGLLALVRFIVWFVEASDDDTGLPVAESPCVADDQSIL